MFKNTTVKQKIYALAFLGGRISSFIAIESIVSIREVGQKLKQISLEDIPLTNKVTEITIHQLEQAIRLERSIKYAEIMAHDPKAVKGFKKAVKEFKKYAHKVDAEIVEAEEMVAHVLEIESDPVIVGKFEGVDLILHDIEEEHAVFDEHAYEVFDLLDAGQLAKAEVLAYKIEDEVQALDLHLEELLIELETFTATAATGALKIEKKAERLIIISSIAFVTLFIILSYFIARSIVKSMLAAQSYAEKLSLGDLQAETPVHYFNDEILAVIGALDALKGSAQEAETLREKQARQEEENEAAKRRAMIDLAGNFEESVAEAIASLSEASEQLQRTSSNMKSVADTTTECSTSVARSASESSQNVSAVASAMEEMSASSSEIASQITLVKNKSNQAAESARSASGTVNNLNELVANIGEVVYAIQDIAEQTNLLALNATIEAARAGEAGKGFAVVADEVKKLATETSVKTQEINERITEIQEATHASVESMDTIIGNITDIDGSVTSVSAAVEEQNVATNEIVRSVSDASQGTQEVSAVIVDVQQGLAEVGRAAGSVLDASETATSLSRDLKKSVDDFLSGIRRDNKC